jgi:hypothetical protein
MKSVYETWYYIKYNTDRHNRKTHSSNSIIASEKPDFCPHGMAGCLSICDSSET